MNGGLYDDPPLSIRAIEKVARKEGIDSTELTEPLFETINPDALDSLFTNGSGKVVFEYLDYQITVQSSGEISVVPLEER